MKAGCISTRQLKGSVPTLLFILQITWTETGANGLHSAYPYLSPLNVSED